MIKIFVHKSYHELEQLVNSWITTKTFEKLELKYSTFATSDTIYFSVLIHYTLTDSSPC